MKPRFPFGARVVLCLLLGAFAGGCGSMPTFELPSMPTGQKRMFQEDTGAMYDASRAVLEEMNYAIVRGSRAAGKLEMAARVQPSATLRARQRRAELEFKDLDSGETELNLEFWEASEDESAAGTVTPTNRLLRDGTLYQVFWDRLAEKLGHGAAAPQVGTP